MRICWGKRRENVAFTCGHSILNRSSTVNVGLLMLRLGLGLIFVYHGYAKLFGNPERA